MLSRSAKAGPLIVLLRKLAAMIDAAKGEDRTFMRQLVESLTVAAVTEDDFKLIQKYFG